MNQDLSPDFNHIDYAICVVLENSNCTIILKIYIEQFHEATSYKIAAVLPLTSHLYNHTNKTNKTLLEK